MSNKLVKNRSLDEDNCASTFWNGIGATIIVLGIVSFILMLFVYSLPQDYDKYNIPLFFGAWTIINVAFILIGVILYILSLKSKKFQKWAEKDLNKLVVKTIKEDPKLSNDLQFLDGLENKEKINKHTIK